MDPESADHCHGIASLPDSLLEEECHDASNAVKRAGVRCCQDWKFEDEHTHVEFSWWQYAKVAANYLSKPLRQQLFDKNERVDG